MDTLGVFHAMCLDFSSEQRMRLPRPETGLSPSVKYFY